MTRVVVMLHHGLGDVITALPGLSAADQILGSSGELHIIFRSPVEASLVQSFNWRARLHAHFIPPGPKWARASATVSLLREIRATRPDVFAAMHVSSRIAAGAFALALGARRSVLPTSSQSSAPARRPTEHKALYYARFLQKAGVPLSLNALQFPPIPAFEQNAPCERRIVLAPAVGAQREQHKAWPPAQFAALTAAIAHRWPSFRIEYCASPQERPLLQSIAAASEVRVQPLISIVTPETPFLATQHLVGAACVVSACSGAAHLAALAGAPIVGLFGPTDPTFTGPFSRNLHVVRQDLACSPCYRPGFIAGCGLPICMRTLAIEPVLTAISAVLDASPQLEPKAITTSPAEQQAAGRIQ